MISIILPAYRCANTLRDAVDSVLAQTECDWELLIAEDGSGDDTASLVAALAESDQRIHYLPAPVIDGVAVNAGAAAARNRALTHAQGEWVAFLDADDIWLSEKLSQQLHFAHEQSAEMCCTAYIILTSPPRVRRVPVRADYRALLGNNTVGMSSVLLRRELLGDAPFETSFFHEDYVLWLKLTRDGRAFAGLDEPLVQYRTGGRSADKANAARWRWAILRRGEKLSLPRAAYWFFRYACSALRK